MLCSCSVSDLFIARSFPPFRTGPGDIAEGVFDIAGLAVQAVAEIQLDSLDAAAAFRGLHLINVPGTKARAGTTVCRIALPHANLLVVNNDMAGLIFPMHGAG